MTKNILFLMGVYPSYGGVEKVTTVLANEFVRLGHNVSIASFEQPHPELAKSELNQNVELFQLDYPVFSTPNVQKLHTILCQHKIDILINQWCVPYYVARLIDQAKKETKCKIIGVHHNSPDTNARIKAIEINIENRKGISIINRTKLSILKLISRLSLRYTYQVCDEFIVLSPSFISLANRFIFLSDKKSKIKSITNPITIDSVDRVVEKSKEVIYVGRIEYNQKRTFRVVDVWKELEPMYPEWHLSIVGDGPDREDLEKRISEYGLNNIEITGFTDPKPYYEAASLLLLTSEYEGFALVIVEGMYYGVVPVVYGSYSSVYDIIEQGVNGLITSMPYSRDETVRCLKKLMDNEKLRNGMAENAIERSADFSLTSIISQWENLFNSIQ